MVKNTQAGVVHLFSILIVVVLLAVVGFFVLRDPLSRWLGGRDSEGVEKVKVVFSGPLSERPHLTGTQDALNGITLALEEAGYMAGGVEVELIVLDDGDENRKWQKDLETKNAELAVADESVVAYLGPMDSGAAKVSMPILNRAAIAQVSITNTWPGLTKEGFLPGEPGKFYPTGIRHYVRVVTSDDLMGPASAIWAKELGFNAVYIVDDGDAFGKGVTDLFHDRASDLGMTVLKHKTIDRTSTDFSSEVVEIKQLNPDLVFYVGHSTAGAHLLKQMRGAGVEAQFMGSDTLMSSEFIRLAGNENAEGVLAMTAGALALDIGTPKAVRYHDAYVERFAEESLVFGLLGYESMNVILSAIENADVKNRAEILNEVKNTKDFKGALGTWSFDKRGDTTLKLMSGNVVRDGAYEFVKILQSP